MTKDPWSSWMNEYIHSTWIDKNQIYDGPLLKHSSALFNFSLKKCTKIFYSNHVNALFEAMEKKSCTAKLIEDISDQARAIVAIENDISIYTPGLENHFIFAFCSISKHCYLYVYITKNVLHVAKWKFGLLLTLWYSQFYKHFFVIY